MKKKMIGLMAASVLLIPQLSQAEESINFTYLAESTRNNQALSVQAVESKESDSLATYEDASPGQNPISILDFKDVSFPKSISKDQNVTISFSIENNGANGAKNVVIKALSQDLQGLVPKSVSQVNAKRFSPKQKEKYTFVFRITDNAVDKNYPITLSLAYTDEATGQLHQSQQVVTVKVKGTGSSGSQIGDLADMGMGPSPSGPSMDLGPSLPITPASSGSPGANQGSNVPKIIIEEYSLDPSTAQAGLPFNLNLRIFNTNRKKTVRNIRVSLTADAAEPMAASGNGSDGLASGLSQGPGSASAFTPVGSSNTFYIESIKPRKYFTKEITLTTPPDLAPKSYTITANFEYEDADGNPYQSSEIIGVPLVQKSQLSLGDLQLEKEGASIGTPLPLSLEFFNTGKSPLSNVMVKIRGNFSSDTSTYFAGTLAPGASDSYDVDITPDQAGKQKGEVVISYDDASGTPQEVVKPFEVKVEEEASMDNDTQGSANVSRPSWALPLGIGGLLIILAGLGFLLWRKKKQNKDKEDLQV